MFKKAIITLGAVIAFAAPALADTTIVRETTVVDTNAPVLVPGGTTITTRTTTTPDILALRSRPIHFEDFDINRDSILAPAEIGEVLFRLYDTDGNMVIDNIEYERPAVLTLAPMQTTTRIAYDFNGDGIADQSVVTRESFLQRTMLSRFDRNGNGLTPHEFMGQSFLVADTNNDKQILLKEWKGSYIATLDKKNRADGALNK